MYSISKKFQKINCFHGSFVLLQNHQTCIIQRGYYSREGIVGSSFVKDEASPQPHDCLIAGVVLMGYSHLTSPRKGTCSPGAFLVKALFINKVICEPHLLVVERMKRQSYSQITWQDFVGPGEQAQVLMMEQVV